MTDDQKGVLRIHDGIPIPPLDPLDCNQAIRDYARGEKNLAIGEKFTLLLHIADNRGHQPACPAHDPGLLTRLQEALGINDLSAT